MIEDLTGNIKRIVDGIADEVERRVASDLRSRCTRGLDCQVFYEGDCDDIARVHVRQVLYDWFLGEYIPGEKK